MDRASWRRFAASAFSVDRGTLVVPVALPLGITTTVILFVALVTDHVTLMLPAALGPLWVALCDPQGDDGRRTETLFWAAGWSSLAVLIGGLTSDPLVVHLVAAAVVAAACGFAGSIGPRAATIGVLFLVAYAIFSGTPTIFHDSFANALSFLAGSVLYASLISVPALAHRHRGPRLALARLYRGLAHVDLDDSQGIGHPVHAERMRSFLDTLAAERAGDATHAWLRELGDAAGEVRLALVGLTLDPEAIDERTRLAVAAYLRAAQEASRRIARALVLQWPARSLAATQESLDRTFAGVLATAAPFTRTTASAVHDGMTRTVSALSGPWPLTATDRPSGPHRTRRPWRDQALDVKQHLSLSDPIGRHAIRQSVVYTVATVLSLAIDLPHPYWMPMTVAWISKPAMSDTTVKVIARVTGTLLGVVVAFFVVEHLGPPNWVLAVLVGVGGTIVITFVLAQYTYAVIGITMFVLFLFTIDDGATTSAFGSRIFATVSAGGLVLLGTWMWPTRTGSHFGAALADYTRSLRHYTRATLTGRATDDPGRVSDRNACLDARIAANRAVVAAAYEFGSQRVDAVVGATALESLHLAVAHVVALDVASAEPEDHEILDQIIGELTDLEHRLATMDVSGEIPRRDHPPEISHPVHRHARHAHRALDAARERRTASRRS